MAPKMPDFKNFRPQQLRDAWQPQGTSGVMLASWAISCFLALIIPVAKWGRERGNYYNYQGQYNEYEQQQRQYEQQQEAAENGYYYGATECQWWNFRCRSNMNNYQQYANNGEDQDERYYEQMQLRASMPNWFFFFGGKLEEDDREREEMGVTQSQGNMKFVYFWSIFMFIGLAVYGWMTLYKDGDRMGLIIALAIFGQFALLNLITTVAAVSTDDRDMEDSIYGWYGQFSVLLAYTDFWMMLQTFGFAVVLGVIRYMDTKKAATTSEDQEEIQMGYQGADDNAAAGDAVVV